MRTALALFYMGCFAACAIPGIVRIRRRRSSADLSVWREIALLSGIVAQLAVMATEPVCPTWRVWLSPCVSLTTIAALLWHVYRYR